MAQRYSPDLGPREPIKPLRLKEEEPGGFIGFLVWWRKRGGVFWWTTILTVLTIATLVGLGIWISRSIGHLDFRENPDVTAQTKVFNATISPSAIDALGTAIDDITIDVDKATSSVEASLAAARSKENAAAEVEEATDSLEALDVLKGVLEELEARVDKGVVPPLLLDKLNQVSNETAIEVDKGTIPPAVLSALNGMIDEATAAVNKSTIASGDTLFITVSHENIGGSEAGAVTVNIHLPDELTAKSVQPGTPACSQASKLERFASDEAGQINDKPGGTMLCLLGTRVARAKGEIIMEVEVGDVAEGTDLNVDAWLATYRTDNVRGVKEEFSWSNNCTSLGLEVGSGGSTTARSLECSSLGFIAQSINVKAEPAEPTPGEPITITASYENIPSVEDGEQESVAVDIRLPNELTAGKLLQYNDDKALTENLTCSHPNQTEEFASEGRGPVTTASGGTLTCLVKPRSDGAEGRVRFETSVANVASGTTLNVEVCARHEQNATARPEHCKSLAVLVQEPEE